jgi:hypothetical protein
VTQSTLARRRISRAWQPHAWRPLARHQAAPAAGPGWLFWQNGRGLVHSTQAWRGGCSREASSLKIRIIGAAQKIVVPIKPGNPTLRRPGGNVERPISAALSAIDVMRRYGAWAGYPEAGRNQEARRASRSSAGKVLVARLVAQAAGGGGLRAAERRGLRALMAHSHRQLCPIIPK